MDYSVEGVIGLNVGALRRTVGLSHADLGNAMEALGFAAWRHRQTVMDIEVGARAVTWEELFALAALFEVGPTALLTSPAGATPRYDSVRIGGTSIPARDYTAWWDWSPASWGAPPAAVRGVIHQVLGDRPPWDWRTALSKGPAAAREAFLRDRERYPGPTFLADERVEVRRKLPAGGEAVVVLEPGVPHVARDETEAEALREEEEKGRVRKIDRHTARRMRQRGRKR
jgi:hypothetical protein